MLVVVSIGYAQKESRPTSTDPKLIELKKELREAKKELSSTLEENKNLKLNLSEFSGLLSSTKKNRIHSAHKLWGNKLPQKSIAVICDATETQVSTEFKILNNGYHIKEKVND